jgi:hypothetical protein
MKYSAVAAVVGTQLTVLPSFPGVIVQSFQQFS